MAHFYATGFRGVMDMPIRAFWVFLRNIERIEAQNSLYGLRVGIASQSSEAAQELSQNLNLVIGEAIVPDLVAEPPDQGGLNDLRSMNNAFS